jgi:hypothetical protein
VGGAWLQQAFSQEAPPPGPPGQRGERDPAQMQQRMEQFRQQMADRMRQALGATEEEWKVLQPRIEKVQTLSRATRGGGGMGFMMMGGRGGPGDRRGGDRPQGDRPQSAVETAGAALQKVLDNKEAKVEEIKAALTALREARAKAKAELETAQKELREVITVRQEAQLVTMGLLD